MRKFFFIFYFNPHKKGKCGKMNIHFLICKCILVWHLQCIYIFLCWHLGKYLYSRLYDWRKYIFQTNKRTNEQNRQLPLTIDWQTRRQRIHWVGRSVKIKLLTIAPPPLMGKFRRKSNECRTYERNIIYQFNWVINTK